MMVLICVTTCFYLEIRKKYLYYSFGYDELYHILLFSRDAERKRKVKDIYHMLANQEGDYKKMKRGHVT